MTVASVTAKRIADNVIFQATGDTPFTFTGLGSGIEYDLTMPDGTVMRRMTLSAASLDRLSSTQVINSDENQTSYISPGTFTANQNADLIVAVVTLYVANTGPTSLDVSIGDTSMTESFLSITRGSNGRSFGIYTLNASAIPSGANSVTVGGFIGQDAAEMRACQVELIQFSGANQSNPLYFGLVATFFGGQLGALSSNLTIQAATDQHIALFTQIHSSNSSALPMTASRAVLRASETGTSNANSVSSLITAYTPGVTGASSITATMSGAGLSSSMSFGVRSV